MGLKEKAEKVIQEEEMQNAAENESLEEMDDLEFSALLRSCMKKDEETKEAVDMQEDITLQKKVRKKALPVKKQEESSEKTEQTQVAKEKGVEIVEHIAYALTVALLIPMLIPLILKGCVLLLGTDLATTMYAASKAWILIVQTAAIFICLKFGKIKSYLFMVIVPAAIFLIELVIWLLLLIPVW